MIHFTLETVGAINPLNVTEGAYQEYGVGKQTSTKQIQVSMPYSSGHREQTGREIPKTMSEDEPKLFDPRRHLLCDCERVLKAHCEYFKMDGGLFHNCVYRLMGNSNVLKSTDGKD